MRFFAKKEGEMQPRKTGSFGLKLISLLVLFVILLFLFSETVVFATYMLPVISTIILSSAISGQADLIEYLVLWGFPMLFISVLSALFHFVCIRYILIRVFRWFIRMWSLSSKSDTDSSQK